MRKLVILAYSCEPDSGGEHEVGWRFSEEIARLSEYEVHVITRLSNKEKIEKYELGANYHFIDSDYIRALKKKGKFSYIYYIYWQYITYRYIKNNFSKQDKVHLITFGNIHLPSFIWLLKNEYSIGPMGGGAFVDVKLIIKPSIKERLKTTLYKNLNFVSKYNPIFQFYLHRANKVIVRTNDTKSTIPSKYHYKVSTMIETGVDSCTLARHSWEKKERVCNFVNVSRFIESKNIEVSIRTFLELNSMNNNEFVYTLIGDGPLYKNLKNKYSSTNVKFLGKMERQDVINILKSSDVMLTCTVKEGGSHSLYEAMTNNCLVACYNISGMEVFPPTNSAIKYFPGDSVSKNIVGFASLINSQLMDINQLTVNAKEELQKQTWELKAKNLYDIIK